MEYMYQAKFETDPDGGFVVTFPDVPEAITAGENRAEALENAVEALGLALRSYSMRGLPLPVPQQYKGLVEVTVDAWNALKLAVVEAFNEANITKTELAHRLGKKETEARRILDPNYPTKLQTLEQALSILGKQVVITIKDAA
ncbi:type II toxin-antitoxin system HicB family antitoxin [Bartonella tribocorum]|uniref:HicB family protein n=1 Tax=Bartonella tribocorum TaxID=85701 RepID=A0A2N9Y8G5_9HYPH|nr:type II toxin-antitoxin system HicB family antitoxin [Bartonella tribocorum]PIT67998.1 HicB family protein [Bartonella tribocorum]